MQKSKVLLAEVTDHWLHSPFSSRASCLSLGHRPVHALKWPDVKQTSWREAGRGGGRGPLSSYLLSPLASEQPPHPPILSFFGAPHPPHLLQDILGPPRTKPPRCSTPGPACRASRFAISPHVVLHGCPMGHVFAEPPVSWTPGR